MSNFREDKWEERLLIDNLTKLDIFGRRKRIEKSVLDIFQVLNIYFENVAIRENDPISLEVYDRFSEVFYITQEKLTKHTPLKTAEKYKEIALFIDGLVLYGTQKGEAIEATADWLGKGKDIVEKAAKDYCKVKFETKSQIANFTVYKKVFPVTASLRLLPFIKAQKRPFIANSNEIQSAYDLMMSDLEAFEGKNFLSR